MVYVYIPAAERNRNSSAGTAASPETLVSTWPSDKIVLSLVDEINPQCRSSVELFLFGAHIVSWNVNGDERLWMSSLSVMDGKQEQAAGCAFIYYTVCQR